MAELITTAELAARLHYKTRQAVHMAVRRGKLPRPIKRGRAWLFDWIEVLATMRSLAGVSEGTPDGTQGTNEAAQASARTVAGRYGHLRNTPGSEEPLYGQAGRKRCTRCISRWSSAPLIVSG